MGVDKIGVKFLFPISITIIIKSFRKIDFTKALVLLYKNFYFGIILEIN